MSYLNDSGRPHPWTHGPARTSFRRQPGCMQCGSTLDLGDAGGSGFSSAKFSGKCDNCAHWVSDDDDFFDDLDD